MRACKTQGTLGTKARKVQSTSGTKDMEALRAQRVGHETRKAQE